MIADRKQSSHVSAGESPAVSQPLRAWLLLAMVTLFVGRVLLPSEGVSWTGDGQPFDFLWLLLAAGYFVLQLKQGFSARPMTAVDYAVGALVAACAASAWFGAREGTPRFAINMLWEWTALGASFFLTRQLLRTEQETRTLLAIMMALAVTVACYGFFQVFVSLPADRAAYAQDPDALLESVGQWFPPGSPERINFENRLQSTEPLATFALTNSLAGFLTPWLLVLLGTFWSALEYRQATAGASKRATPRWTFLWLAMLAALAVCAVALTVCLVLTKSRSAYIALAVGMVVLPWSSAAFRCMFTWKIALGVLAVVSLIVAGAWAFHGLDAEVLTEASKSLGYRWEYWRATVAMIKEYPVFGVGPGNFQDYYTQFKLPEASEEIRDPHNFLLEVWATSGTIALVALLSSMALFARRLGRRRREETVPDAVSSVNIFSDPFRNTYFMAAGGAVGFLFAYLIGPLVGWSFSEVQFFGGLLIGAAALTLLGPWIVHGTLPPLLPAVGVLALAIHLLAAGGFLFPGVAGTFWILLAVALNETQRAVQVAPRRGAAFELLGAVGLAIALTAATICYLSACRPVLQFHAAMGKAEVRQQTPEGRDAALREAAEADPLSPDPWSTIAQLELARLVAAPTEPRRAFMDAAERFLTLRPHSDQAWRQVGQWYSELFRATGDPSAASRAVTCLRHAVELYPSLATLRGEYALALAARGDRTAATQQAAVALELDAETPHLDKKVPPKLKEQMRSLSDPLR